MDILIAYWSKYEDVLWTDCSGPFYGDEDDPDQHQLIATHFRNLLCHGETMEILECWHDVPEDDWSRDRRIDEAIVRWRRQFKAQGYPMKGQC